MSPAPNLTTRIAEVVSGRRVDPDEGDIADRVARVFADTVGVAVLGHDTDAVQLLLSTLTPLPEGPCRILGSSLTTDARTAALVNGTASHAMDFDDVSESSYTHPSAVIVPVVCAISDQREVTHLDVIEAYVLAYQLDYALGPALRIREHYSRGWHASGVLGPVVAAAAAARLLRLNTEKTVAALGLSLSGASSTTANFGSMAKPLVIGRAAHTGVWSALLARAGYTAGADPIGGSGGLLEMFGTDPENSTIVDDMEGPWALTRHGPDLKPYPACSAARCTIDAVRVLDVDPTRIVAIEVTVEPHGLDALVHDRAHTADEARFSLPTLVALAVQDGTVDFDSFAGGSLNRPVLAQLSRKVSARTAEIPPCGSSRWVDAFSVVRVTLDDGNTVVARADAPVGEPWPWIEIKAKFDTCVGEPERYERCWNSITALARGAQVRFLLNYRAEVEQESAL